MAFTLEPGGPVYIPDEYEGYKRGTLIDFRAECLRIELSDGSMVDIPQDDILPAEEDEKKDVDDSCALMYLNEGTLLNNCRQRYRRKQIYTYVANILISINPYESIDGLYANDTIAEYQGKSLGALPPHIFAIADKAHRDLRRNKESQSIIVSGESGAGKTESQKYVLRYLCDRWGASAGPIEQRLLDANPILEAFGNAKTIRNNNSSRFGKFVEIHFGKEHTVVGGHVSHYLLEKSRLCHQNEGERNYHVFYQLLAGADDALAEKLGLASPDTFNYLKSGSTQFFATSSASSIPASRRSKFGTITDSLLDDILNFKALQKALTEIGFSDVQEVFSIIAGILHLGNVQFESSEAAHGGCAVVADTVASLNKAAELFGLNNNELNCGLTSRAMQSLEEIIMVPLKPHEATAARDALVKSVYSHLFDSIVAAINSSIPFSDSTGYIGVLDIAGFEFFKVNSFEQFCINYCNEKLQQFFNERILKHEQELYRREALNVAPIEYSNNQDCIELFEQKGQGLFDLLDEEARLPGASPLHFTVAVHEANAGHFRLDAPRKSRLREHRDMRDNEGFLIRHGAGAVCYQTAQFLEKNNDALHASLRLLMEQSENFYMKDLFKTATSAPPTPILSTPGRTVGAQKLAAASVGSKFRSQLNVLLEKLRSTGTHFVRCIKPNSEMTPSIFEGAQILSQLKCAGMGSVLRLMHCGFPSRASFNDLYQMYQNLLPEQLKRLDARLFCKCLFHALGLSETDFQFGLTKAFFRAGKFAEFDELMHQDEAHMTALIGKVQAWLVRMRWRKVQYTALTTIRIQRIIADRKRKIAKVQSYVRGYLIRKNVTKKLQSFRKLNSLAQRFSKIKALCANINELKKGEYEGRINEMIDAASMLTFECKQYPTTANDQLVLSVEGLEKELNQFVEDLKHQIVTVESTRLEAIEAETRRQRELAEQEERERQEKEAKLAENRKFEARLQKEKEEGMKREAELKAQRKEDAAKEVEEALKRERERLGGELAQRLVRDTLLDQSLPPESTVAQDFIIGTTFNAQRNVKPKYTIIGIPDAGGFGTILHVKDDTGKDYAIKVERFFEGKCNSVKNEAKVYAELKRHQTDNVTNFMAIYDSGLTIDGKYWFMIMPLMGENLYTFKQNNDKIDVYTITRIFQQSLLGLMDLHQSGFLHRDIKPQNILFARPESPDRQLVFLIDFGLSQYIQTVRNPVKSFIGTSDYASVSAHELWQQSRADDLFSLWLTIFSLFKQLPWEPLEDDDMIYAAKAKFVRDSSERKSITEGIPARFIEILEYILSLEFDEIPDYSFLHHLLNNIITKLYLPEYRQGLRRFLNPVLWDPSKPYSGPNYGSKGRQKIFYQQTDDGLKLYVNGFTAYAYNKDKWRFGYATFIMSLQSSKEAGFRYKIYVQNFNAAKPDNYPDVVLFDDTMMEPVAAVQPNRLEYHPPLGKISVELTLIDVEDDAFILDYDFNQIFKKSHFGGYEIINKKALINLVTTFVDSDKQKYDMVVDYDSDPE